MAIFTLEHSRRAYRVVETAQALACAAHHHHVGPPGCFGVTSAFWDHVFASAWPGR